MFPLSMLGASDGGAAGTELRAARPISQRFDAVASRVSVDPGSGNALRLICEATTKANASITIKKIAVLSKSDRMYENTPS